MRLGEAITETAELMRDNPVVTVPYSVPSAINDCCYTNDVLAERLAEITDPLRNDKSRWTWFYSNSFSDAVMKLEKLDENGVWQEVADLNSDTFGTYYPFGFFTNSLGEKAMSFLIDWHIILMNEDNMGEGKYRIVTIDTPLFGSSSNQYSWEYCLRRWTQPREDNTIKFEWNNNGLIGHAFDKKKQRDFGIQNLYNQIRLGGHFGRPSSPFEDEYVKYQAQTPGFGKMVRIKHSFYDEYLVEIYPIPYYVHQFLKHDMMLSDNLLITDFNSLNPVHLIQQPVKPNTNWEPRWYEGAKKSSVELKFDDSYRNNIHRYS